MIVHIDKFIIDMISETSMTFTGVTHIFNSPILLTKYFNNVDTPQGFKNLQLYPHQQKVVCALIDIEDNRILTVTTQKYSGITGHKVIVETSAAVLSEPFGSGKTAEILGLILYRPIPKAVPTHVNSIILQDTGIMMDKYGSTHCRTHHSRDTLEFNHEIIRKFTGPRALIKPNLIVVGSSVLLQWKNNIDTYTSLKCFVVGDYYKVKKLYDLYISGDINNYDIILLKNGKVTGNFSFIPDHNESDREYGGLINAVNDITKFSCWSRVIYDDYDTINIPTNSMAINSLFTIYVSATTKVSYATVRGNITYDNILDAMANRQTCINYIVTDSTLFNNFNVKNSIEIVESSTNIPIIEGKRYVYNNPSDNYIRLLGAMGEEDATNIMEMLNGDAIETAAIALGIKSTSVADIFQKMLDDKYQKFLYDKHILESVHNIKNMIIPTLEDYPDNGIHSAAEIDHIRQSILKKTTPIIKYRSPALDRLLDDINHEYLIAKDQDGLAINRVIDNIKEGECQICRLPLIDFNAFIVRCCGLIVCDVCGIKGNRIQRRYDRNLKCDVICGACANCKAVIYPQRDLVFVDKTFNMDSLLNAKGDEKAIEDVPAQPAINDAPENELKNPKLRALIKIINGETAENGESIKINIKHLLAGRVNIPSDRKTLPKVLVFANYNETLNIIEDTLHKYNINFLRLGGTFQEKHDTVRKFKTSDNINVLLINSQHNCAGICLEFASDLVFFHKITDPNIESQVAGRIQRIGRKNNARIHYLVYRNEAHLI